MSDTELTISQDDNKNREKAKLLYWQGMRVSEIAALLGEKPATVHSWKKRDAWDRATTVDRVDAALCSRFIYLIGKEDKTNGDIKEMDALGRLMERTAKAKKFEKGGSAKDLNSKLSNRGRKANSEKNFVDPENIEKLESAFRDIFFKFDYQKLWFEKKLTQKVRNILKSRQIGATYYFAHEAILDAILTGDNQIFLSASRAQADVFRTYITQFVKDVTGVELRGNPIILWNGATLYFLAMNKNTAQGYHGHVYNDEYFWIPKFEEFRRVTSGMALHKKWRITYFSTPSTMQHQGYPFWTGDRLNKGKKEPDKISIDVSHESLKGGRLCEDNQWKHIVTIEDAVAGGCDLFPSIEDLRLDYSDQEFANLLMCQFIDDTQSIFSLAEMQACMVDSWEKWDDFEPLLQRPFARRSVWLGYDPSRSKDDASCVVLAPPEKLGHGKFRILEKFRWNDRDFEWQAAQIEKLTKKYNVQYIGVDVSGMGINVFDLVKKFYPAATQIRYSVDEKNKMVLKAKNVIRHGRLEFDAGWNDVALAFMTIHRNTTPNAQQISYGAARTDETGHADVAWSIMHALINEPIDAAIGNKKSMMEMY